jgi:hypothetical protein
MAKFILRKVKKDWYYESVHQMIKIRQNGKPLWTRHDDKDVDVAVMYISVPPEVAITLLPIDFLADDKDLVTIGIHPGDELMCVGYPFGTRGGSCEFPILRSGKIASHSILPTNKTIKFMYDFEVFEGNSGSPVYMSEILRPMLSRDTEKISPVIVKVNVVVGMVIGQYLHKGDNIPLKLAEVVHSSLIRETIKKLPDQP